MLLLLAVLLPQNLVENDEEIDNGRALPNHADSLTVQKKSVNVLVEEDSQEDDTNLTKPAAQYDCLLSSMVLCLYYLVCLSLFLYVTITLYFPLLMKFHLGLGLSYVKLTFLNSSLFVFLLFLTTLLFVEKISEQNFLIITTFSLAIPIFITLYFGLFWNGTMAYVNGSYLLLFSMLVSNAQFLNIPVTSSLLSKITPVENAAFFQSLLYTTLHLGMCVGRLVAGATFGKTSIICASAGLAFSWLIGLIWLGYEYHNFALAVNLKKSGRYSNR